MFLTIEDHDDGVEIETSKFTTSKCYVNKRLWWYEYVGEIQEIYVVRI